MKTDSQSAGSPVTLAVLESAAVDPTQFPARRALTGTTDDDDAPGDEHARENEAAARERSEDTETPEEFGYDREESRLFAAQVSSRERTSLVSRGDAAAPFSDGGSARS